MSIALHTDRAVGGTAGPVTRLVEHTHHSGANEHDGPRNDSAKDGCLKFCVDQFSAVTKSEAHQTAVLGPCSMAIMQLPLMPRIADPAATEWTLVERPASVGPPLFIRLLRLTI